MDSGYKKTGFPGIYTTPNKRYVVQLYYNHKMVYIGRYDTLHEAEAACKTAREQMDTIADVEKRKKMKDTFYVPIIPLVEQCARCSSPHLPGSEYCEYHANKAEKTLRTTAK